MKSGKEHRVPLSTAAMAILRSLPRGAADEFVFAGTKAGRPVGNAAMFRVLKALRSDVTVHGFRSTFRVWAEERTAFPAVVAEQALAHNVGSAVERAYRRTTLLEQRARLMQQWGEFATNPSAVGDVVPLRGRS
jgi:integrase